MNTIDIYYRACDGEIYGWVTGGAADPQPGCLIVTIVINEGCQITPNPHRHKIDVVSLELVEKSPDEIYLAQMPTLTDVRALIATDLRATDQYALPDFPVSQDMRAAWLGYRATLRDLSKTDAVRGRTRNVVEMLHDWPLRPDGGNAAASLQERVESKR